jgi:hypothetical protein
VTNAAAVVAGERSARGNGTALRALAGKVGAAAGLRNERASVRGQRGSGASVRGESGRSGGTAAVTPPESCSEGPVPRHCSRTVLCARSPQSPPLHTHVAAAALGLGQAALRRGRARLGRRLLALLDGRGRVGAVGLDVAGLAAGVALLGSGRALLGARAALVAGLGAVELEKGVSGMERASGGMDTHAEALSGRAVLGKVADLAAHEAGASPDHDERCVRWGEEMVRGVGGGAAAAGGLEDFAHVARLLPQILPMRHFKHPERRLQRAL